MDAGDEGTMHIQHKSGAAIQVDWEGDAAIPLSQNGILLFEKSVVNAGS